MVEVRSSADPYIAFASVQSESALQSYYFWLSGICLMATFVQIVLLFLYYKCQISYR